MLSHFWKTNDANSRVTPSFESIRLANLVSVSFLVSLTACIGRIRVQSVLFAAIIFNILFNLNFYLNLLLCYSVSQKD